jgi:CubicO group peptidase (beta-lactamase class C family)
MKSDRTADQMAGFAEFATETLATWHVPSAAVAVVKDGEVVLAEGFGVRTVPDGAPVNGLTLFAIGSCTKAFTGTSLGILVDDGKLDLDRPVREYLPEFRMHDPVASERITPRDLVCHRSGLPGHNSMWHHAPCTRGELLHRIRYLEPSADFRAAYQYQNLMFMAAGCLLERVSGRTWEEFVQQRILDPLGMSRTNFSVRASQASGNFAAPCHEKGGEVMEVPLTNIDAIGPAGSINSCAADMAQWLLLNLNKGRHGARQIISERAFREIHSPQMVVSEPLMHPELLYSSYGMGWIIQPYRGRLLVRHGGRIRGFSAMTSFMPHDNIGVSALSTVDIPTVPVPTILTYQVYERLLGLDRTPWGSRLTKEYEDLQKATEEAHSTVRAQRTAGTHLSHSLADYIGDFEHPGYGVVSIEAAEGGLQATFHGTTYPLDHCHYDSFEMAGDAFETRMTVSFFTDVQGRIASLAIPFEPAVAPIRFTRTPPGGPHQ